MIEKDYQKSQWTGKERRSQEGVKENESKGEGKKWCMKGNKKKKGGDEELDRGLCARKERERECVWFREVENKSIQSAN